MDKQQVETDFDDTEGRVFELAGKRTLRVSESTNDPEELLRAMLHNYRMRNEKLLASSQRAGDKLPRGRGTRDALKQLHKAIEEAERTLRSLQEKNAGADVIPYKTRRNP